MVSEEDFQNHLDQHPDDHQTRMVFADWLQDHDDPRANGYRALGKNKRVALAYRPRVTSGPYSTPMFSWGTENNITYPNHPENLPHNWMQSIENQNQEVGQSGQDNSYWTHHPTRKDADDRAALAFNLLPPERQHELLGLNEPQIDTPQQMSRLTKRRRSYKRYANS